MIITKGVCCLFIFYFNISILPQYCYNKRCDELEKEKEKKPKMKRNRCGTCAGCKMTDVSHNFHILLTRQCFDKSYLGRNLFFYYISLTKVIFARVAESAAPA